LGDGGLVTLLPPLLPTLMAIVRNDVILAILLALVGALVAPTSWAMTERYFGRPSAWIAAGLAATEPSFIRWGPYLLTDIAAVSLFAVALERTSVQFKAARPWAALVAGAAVGLSYTARAAFALPGLVLAFANATTARRGVVLGSFILGALLVVLPFVLRNEAAIGQPVVSRGQTWLLLWAGTKWNEVGRGTDGVDLIYPPGYLTWTFEQRDVFHRDEFIAFIGAHPGEWLVLGVRKAVWFWLPAYPEWSMTHKVLAIPYFSVVYGLALVGALRQRRSPLTWLLLVCVAAVQLTVMATIVDYDDRYRMPAELCLLPLAASGATAVGARFRRSGSFTASGSG
jgi:4-amino-4-deoxy-L-arabinose transferase-like glycosyltransferase